MHNGVVTDRNTESARCRLALSRACGSRPYQTQEIKAN